MKKTFLLMGLAVAFASQAAEYTLDFRGATPLASEVPVVRRAEMPVAVGQIPSVAVGDTLNLQLFEDVGFALRIVSAPPAGIAGQSFIARDENGSASAVVKVTSNSVRIFVDDFMNRRQYTMRCKDGKVLIVERDNSQEDGGECGTCSGEIEMPQTVAEDTEVATPTRSSRQLLGSSGDAFPLAEQKSVVDILVAFDQGAKAWAEKGSNWGDIGDSIEEFADYAVNKMNTVLEKSQLLGVFSYRLAGVVEIDDTYAKIDQTLLGNLRTRADALSRLSQLREKYGADTITLLIDKTQGSTTGVGYGYYPVSSFPGPAAFDGNNYACNICDIKTVYSRYTMSHETGHNMGCDHSTRQGATNSGPGRFEDSSGYHFVDANGIRRYTIMGYNYTADDDYEYYPIPYFSSPGISPEEYGCAVGVAGTNDNRRTLTLTHGDIAGLREHVLPYDWDVRVWEESHEITEGDYCKYDSYGIHTLTLTHADPTAVIYYTLDGDEPGTSSEHVKAGETIRVNLEEEKTLKVCAVVDNTVLAVRTLTLKEGIKWSGESGQSGNGRWSTDQSILAWNDGASSFEKWATVVFPENKESSSPSVTVIGEIEPWGTAFTAIDTAYTFNKNDEFSLLKFRDANFAPAGDVTFNVPAQLSATEITNMTGCAMTFNAPFGQTVDANGGNFTGKISISPYGKMTVAPGDGKTQTLSTLNNRWFAGSATFRVGEGKVVFNGTINGGAGVIGRTKLEVGNGGELVFNVGGGTGHQMDQTSLTIEKGGTVTYNDMEHLRRTLYLSGGTIYAKRLDLMSNPGVYVADDSSIENNGGGYILIRNSDSEINVSTGKSLTLNVGTQTDNRSDTSGWGIIKRGSGTLVANFELKHSGVTDIEEGTLEVGYSSGSTVYGQGWIVASNSTLRVKSGCTLKVPSLTLDPTATISVPAANSAPLTVNGNLDLTEVCIAIHDVEDLSLGASYPLVSATGEISGVKSLVRASWPKPGTGLGWKLEVADGTLTASIVNAVDADPVLDFFTNNSSVRFSLPEGASMTESGSLQLDSSPIVLDGFTVNAIAVTVDVTLGEPSATGRTILSWKIGNNIARCVVTNGVVDCFYAGSLHVDNSVQFVKLSAGRHVINIAYKSLSDNTYGGTFVYVDGTLAYRAAGLRWSNDSVSRVTVGASADGTPAYKYEGLVVNSLALLTPSANEPLPNMTSSGGAVTYDYFAAKSPCVFSLAPSGGFSTHNTLVSGAYSGTYDEMSVSVAAAFPKTETGTILSAVVQGGNSPYSTQIEYRDDGVFAFRDNGDSSLKTTVQVDVDVSVTHLYTMTYKAGEGFRLYLDGDEILTNDDYFKNKSLPAYARIIFGCGYWTNWMTSYNDNPNPMSDFTVYASHIALGTSDRTISEEAVRAAMVPESPEEPGEPEEPDPAPPETPAVVDVLVAYDIGAQSYVAEKGVKLEAFAATQIQKMNDVLATNRLDRFYSYRLAGVCKVNGTYDNIDTAPALAAEGAGPAVSLRAAREIYGADTVTLLVDTTGATLGNSSPLSSTINVASQHECAFSVCSIRAVDSDAQHTMIHENAHNMGCGHARAQSDPASPFSYGRGYYFKDGDVTRHTIMAYGGDNDASWYFSTTSKDFGFTLGDATNNNARVLKKTCSEVAKWRENGKRPGDGLTVTDENDNEIASECFFKNNLKVTVAAPINGAALYYTFDGSDPTLSNYFYSQPSPFTFTFTVSRTLKIAYYDGNQMSPVRTVKVTKCANVPAEGLWQTSIKYPWTVEENTIRSYNQTDYTYQCTSPLKATIEGPKVLSFKHKSYFGGESVAGNNYSHFDVLLDDSPVLTKTECANYWTDAFVVVPEGTHEVTFVFSQRFAMNNPSDYKDGTPEANDAVWLKDISLEEIPMCVHSSTSSNVTWTFPSDAVATDDGLDGIVIGESGIFETLDFGSTNAVILSVLAELPEGVKGEIAGCQIVQTLKNGERMRYAFAYSDGEGVFSLGHGTETNYVTASSVSDWSSLHVWTFAFVAQEGARLYCDGQEIASATGVNWTPSSITNLVTFCDDSRGDWALTGAKVYAVHSDFGVGADIFNQVSDSVSSVISSFDCLADYAEESQATKLALLKIYKTTGSVIGEPAEECVLRISEIMPKPTDDQDPGEREGMDVNGLESGWVEVENTSDQWADLADYRFIRVNRGKKTDPAGYGNFPSRLVPPRGRAIFYTSERYSNGKKGDKDEVCKVSAFAEGTFDGKPMIFEDYGNILVWGDKVNPKKSPYVRLYYAPNDTIESVVDTVVIPSDLPEGWSIIVGDAAEGEGTRRWMCPTPTRGAANTATSGLTRIGPNVGPLYEKKGQKKTDLANEFAVPTPPAVPGEDYVVTLPINPVMNPAGVLTTKEAPMPRAADLIQSIKFVYRKDLDDSTLVTNAIDMATKTVDENWGDRYTATIPASYFPAAGHLIQWKVLITDGEGVEWTSPSFNNKDDGYEWYGTIVEAPELESEKLPTWHMFASGNHLTQMDIDKDKQDLDKVPNYARVAIYDSSTSNYYDYVRIDLRGNTSANFTKKGHGLRFAKAHPLTMTDIVSGEQIKEIRKTSLISEFADPSYMRQMIAFWLWRKMGNHVPFDFPVRCNLNGEFYQLAFNSERFTDELIEDVYKLDKFGYGYKNVGTLNKTTTTAGGIEKKTPDDENESDISVLTNKLVVPLQVYGASSPHTDENADLTKLVVEKFNLPAWINYLASARITQEMDDVWANVCAYYDNPEMKEGARGTGTWMPLGYDFNLSLGQYYYGDLSGVSRFGLSATNDWFKSHPFYGGWTVRARKSDSGSLMDGNNGFEAVLQSPKFRRLYLRRLRTLMDQELKEPGTPEGEVQFMVKMREMADLMRADSTLDLAKWPDDKTDDAIDVWPSNGRPANMDAGIDDIWNNYVVPRREHLYVTHSITNTAWEVGYAADRNAGIPEAQSPVAELAPNFVLAKLSDCVVISNLNNEVVDMSGWTLKFGVEWTLPAGTVCDSNDCIYVVADRRAYIEAHKKDLTDQVILGNAEFVESVVSIALNDASGQSLKGELKADETIEFKADSVEAANKTVENMVPQLTEEDVDAGLETQYLKVVAEPIEGKDGKYTAVVAVNPDKVNAPVIAEPAAESEPVEIEEDDKGDTTVSVSISNAVMGLWYGYEVADELGESAAFANDVDSFERATGSAHTVKGSPRTQPSGFFRLKVLPAKPSKTSE